MTALEYDVTSGWGSPVRSMVAMAFAPGRVNGRDEWVAQIVQNEEGELVRKCSPRPDIDAGLKLKAYGSAESGIGEIFR